MALMIANIAVVLIPVLQTLYFEHNVANTFTAIFSLVSGVLLHW